MSEPSNIEKSQDEVAQVVRKFVEHCEYYEAVHGQLRLRFEGMKDKRIIPGFNFGPLDIVKMPSDQVKISRGDWSLGVYTNEDRETYYANWYGPTAGDYGAMPVDAEIVTPEEVGWDAV